MNRLISASSGFIFGFGVIGSIIQNWTYIIPAVCACIIIYANITGTGE